MLSLVLLSLKKPLFAEPNVAVVELFRGRRRSLRRGVLERRSKVAVAAVSHRTSFLLLELLRLRAGWRSLGPLKMCRHGGLGKCAGAKTVRVFDRSLFGGVRERPVRARGNPPDFVVGQSFSEDPLVLQQRNTQILLVQLSRRVIAAQ